MKASQHSIYSLFFLFIGIGTTLLLADCSQPIDNTIKPEKLGLSAICPGAKNCLKSEGDLKAAAAAISISPEQYEIVRWSYLKEAGFCPKPTPKSAFGLHRCGQLQDRTSTRRKDCGIDGICKEDNVKTRITCNDKTPCPKGLTCADDKKGGKRCFIKYTAPDKDGSQGDGQVDWFLDCGRDRVCPCLAPNGKPAYYGAKKVCLKGHSKNPKYKSPDKDGSEGNGKFEGLWMGGFESNHPVQAKHDDIWARAIVIQTGDTTVAIVSLDLVGFFFDGVELVRKKIEEKLPGKIDYVLISSTHNHEAPDSMGYWGETSQGVPIKTGLDRKFYENIIEKAAEAVVQAQKKLQKVKLHASSIKTGRKGFLRDSRDPLVFEDSMYVLTFTDASSQKNIATIVNWGNHPEALSDTNNYLTSDFSHYLREGIEKGLPASGKFPARKGLGGVAIYLQGAVGCLMTPLGIKIPNLKGELQSTSNWEKSKALGEQLASKAFQAMEKQEEMKAPTLSLWAKPGLLPVENKLFQLAFNAGIFARKTVGYDSDLPLSNENLPKVKTEIAVIRLGEVTFYTLPGEADPETLIGGYDGKYSGGLPVITPDKWTKVKKPDLSKAPKGPYLKEKMPGKYKLFVGLGNDEVGYIIPTWNFVLNPKDPYFEQAEGDYYEETNSLGPKTEPILQGLYKELLKHVNKKSK